MIHFIEGILVSKNAAQAVVDVRGVGYEIFITLACYEALPSAGEKVRLLTHFAVREDAQQLFGFLKEEERELFKLLIGVSGIGPKSAMHILSGIRAADLKEAIFTEDAARLATVPGIGKKTSERIIVELKGKIEQMEETRVAARDLSPQAALWNDALMALISLGYNQAAAQKALKKTLSQHKEASSVEELVRKSLQYV